MASTKLGMTPLEKAVEPELGSQRISTNSYFEPRYLELEAERLWAKTWLLAGPLCDVRESGDYFVFETGTESVLVCRAEDGQLRAFYNVCSHRGNLLMPTACGHVEGFQCAFHSWEYALDGQLTTVPRADQFPQGVPSEQLSLVPLRIDTWGGFVWVCMDPNIEPLADYLGEIPRHLDSYQMDQHVLVMDETVEWNCNWKTSVDIFSETYHVIGVHPEGEAVSDDINVQIDLYGPHSRFIAPMYMPSPRILDGTNRLPDVLRDYLKSEGFPADEYQGDLTTIRKDVAAFKREQSKTTGLDFSNLHDDQLTADFHYNIFPNVTFNLFGEQMWMFRHRPHPTDPNKMYFDRMIFNRVPEGQTKADTSAGAVDLFVELDAGQVEGRPEHISYKHGERSSGLLLDQDASCLGGVQRGLQSRGFRGLWLSDSERRIRNFHAYYERYLAGELP